MTVYSLLAAVLALLMGAFVVATPWDPNVGDNEPTSLVQWVVFWALLPAVGIATGRRVRGWLPRWIVFVPTFLVLAGVAWGDDTLGLLTPLAYLVPSALAWAAGFLVGPRVRRFLQQQADD